MLSKPNPTQSISLSLLWLRWWNNNGKLLLTGEERADRLAAKLQEMGLDPQYI
jgi:hypothetical protein